MSKKIKSIICCLCASLVLIVALCLPFAFKFNTKLTNYASADNVTVDYSFHSSDTYYISSYATNDVTSSSAPILFNGNIRNYNNDLSFQFITYFVSSSGVDISYSIAQNLYFQYKGSTDSVHYSSSDFISIDRNRVCRLLFTDANDTFQKYSECDIFVDNDFNANVYKVTLGLSDTSPWHSGETLPYKFFKISYFDVNEKSFNYYFSVPFAFYYNTRTYFFKNDLNDNQIYSQGYEDGLADNQQNIYKNGYTAGDSVGYNRGYNAGVNATNTYSFTNLISAVLDAPINAFTSLFNFEILGVNLSSFLLALFTICVVLTVIKFIF